MQINWKLKSILFGLVAIFNLYRLLYWLQKNASKRSRVRIDKINENWIIHEKNLKDIENCHLIEFGAGQSLSQNIYLSHFVRSQTLVDLFPMINLELVNQATEQISNIFSQNKYKKVENLSDLRKNYNINYIAPFEFHKSQLEENIFDACISTNTLEHIPKKEIIIIFKDLKRILKNGGLISSIIDYSDHYAHTDKNISNLNFLKYSEKDFKKYNHKSHFQNRLRHNDYLKLFKSLGYEVITNKILESSQPIEGISEEFDIHDKDIFAIKGEYLIKNRK